MPKLRSLDLFSGAGGFALGLLPFARPVAYCDIDKNSADILRRRMQSGDLPEGPIFRDIRNLSSAQFPHTIDLITAGFPCPDVSRAGKRLGIKGGTQTILVHEALRLVKQLLPSYVLFENVSTIVSDTHFPKILATLNSLGYDWAYDFYSAASLGGSHRRDRWFLLAVRRSPHPTNIPNAVCDSSLVKILKPALGSAGCSDCRPISVQNRKLYGNALVPAAACRAFRELSARFQDGKGGEEVPRSQVNFKEAILSKNGVLFTQPRRPTGTCRGNNGKPWTVYPTQLSRRGHNVLPAIVKPYSTMCLPTPRAGVDYSIGGQITNRTRQMLGRVALRTKGLCSHNLRGKKTTRLRLSFLENFMGFPTGWSR